MKTVADGVHVAVAAPAYKVNCNTAIIEDGDGVLVVDTHSKPSAARVIVERIREMTQGPSATWSTRTSTGTTGMATRRTPPPIRARRS